jgi:prepilin-type N-terminal cleavage/methylation domain-containing protein
MELARGKLRVAARGRVFPRLEFASRPATRSAEPRDAPTWLGGFTLVELLVVIAIIGILVALLLPAIQSAREAARRAQCQSDMKNIALAVLNYESSKGRYPPGFVSSGPGAVESWAWSIFILPYLEAQGIYDQMRPSETFVQPVDLSRTGKRNLADMIAHYKADPTNNAFELAPLQTNLSIFRCPSDSVPNLIPADPLSTKQGVTAALPCARGLPTYDESAFSRYFNGIQVSASNYVGSKGQVDADCPFGDADRCANTGVFFGNSQVSSRQVTDGTTYTFMIGERSSFCFAATWVGVRNPPGPDAWSSNWALGHVATPHGKLNWGCTSDHNTCTEGFSSTHPGGGFFAFCDGSVHFINEDISFDGLIGQGPGPQIDSDSNGTPCYGERKPPAGKTACQSQILNSMIGVYQRLAWRNDSLDISAGDY